MTINKFALYWETNEEWYTVDEHGKVHLTEKAPPEAVESFALWQS